MVAHDPRDFIAIYAAFQAPISMFDCGDKCAPYNERGVPFCCDTRHAIPTAYEEEWDYLQGHTDLWHLWHSDGSAHARGLINQAPAGQILIECLGHQFCQRNFRSITCRAFPFFPYFNSRGQFIGLSYYWEYEDRCWVISNLALVSPEYRQEFIAAYDHLFTLYPGEIRNFTYYSSKMRRDFHTRKRAIPLLHRNGNAYKISPRGERMRRIRLDDWGKFGPYRLAAEMPFSDER